MFFRISSHFLLIFRHGRIDKCDLVKFSTPLKRIRDEKIYIYGSDDLSQDIESIFEACLQHVFLSCCNSCTIFPIH